MVRKNKQKGVVLLTCLVFLLIIMGFLRFTLEASRIEQYKVAADTENLTAYEYANMALRDAEFYLQGKTAHGACAPSEVNSLGVDCAEIAKIETDSKLSDDEKQSQKNALIAKALDSRLGQPNSGIYNTYKLGSSPIASCKDKSKNKPFWQCVNWDVSGENIFHGENVSTKYSSVSYGEHTLTKNELKTLQDTFKAKAIPLPRYVIEIIQSKDIGGSVKGRFARVTAVGYGRQGDSGTVANEMLQATYLVP